MFGQLVKRYISPIIWSFVLVVVPSFACAATISGLKANATAVGRYEKYELTFNLADVTPSDYNPFRWETTADSLSPAGVNVRAEIITPSGTTKTVWGFYDVDYQWLGVSVRYPDKGRLVPVSSPHWHIRYAPVELGTHRITVKVTDAGGTTTSSQLTFNCIESGKKGFVRVSQDKTRFVYSDGSPYVPFGTMAPYGVASVDSTVAKMKANGMNFLRRWLVNRDEDDIHRNLEGWSPFTGDSTVYRSGKRSAVKTVSGTGTIVDQSYVACKGDTYYKAFAYFKTSSSFNGTVAVSVVEARTDGANVTRTGNAIGPGQNWAYSQVVFKTAPNAEILHFKPQVLSGSSGTVWIDDVGLYECDSSGNVVVDANYLFNPSFEEWTPIQLRMLPLARFEYLLQQCEANDILVQPTIFDYRLWNKSSPTGFYASYFGDWWTDAASIAQQERVLRYLVARFAHYRSLFAWELTNEMDASYTDIRGNWIRGRANFIRSGDPASHPITNSYWSSPADYEYAQMPEIDLGQVHYYINTEERTTGQGYPSWWNLSDGMSIETNPSNVASGSKALKATANGNTISDSATVYCQPGKSYTLKYRIKTSGVSGQASVIVRFYGGSSPGSTITLTDSGTANYTLRSQTFTTGSTADSMEIILQLTGSSGTAWWDDIELIDNSTGLSALYNGGFESPLFGDDEFEWAVYNTLRTRERYAAGANGVDKAWASGEWGLMGANADLSAWANPKDTTKPRHDSTGIHVHNCIWAQLMASAAMNTPTYWWVWEYIIPYDLYSAWKGATSFAKVLPFYDRGQTVSTDAGIAAVIATSSDPRIRILGQKKSSTGYFWIQNKEHTWSRVIREGLQPTPTSATVTIPGFENGSYRVDWYDSYTGSLVKTETRSVAGGNLQLSVSSLTTDIAAVVRRTDASASKPEITLSLSTDKATASPSEVVTYTLSYRNVGSGDAANVTVTLPIPAGTTYVEGSASGGGTYDPATNSVKWIIQSLAPDAAGQCTARVRIN